jgi:hypothetical protein
MKALISPEEIVYLNDGTEGIRIAQVESDENIFDIAPPLYWIDCPEDCNANEWYYKDGNFLKIQF